MRSGGQNKAQSRRRPRIITALLFFLFFIGGISAASSEATPSPTSEEEVAKAIMQISKKYEVPAEDIFTLISIESDFEPLVITIETTPERAKILTKLRNAGLRIVAGGRTFHSKRSIVDIYPPDISTAISIARALKRNGFTFDVGLVQVNSGNFNIDEVSRIFYPYNNIERAAKIYRECIATYKTKIHQVECYNRGAGNLRRALRKGTNYYPYWNRYRRHYKQYFQ